MEILEITANEGIGQIKLDMDREEVYRILGKSGNLQGSSEWIDNYHVVYEENRVVFIELPNVIKETHFVLFKGVDVFRTEAKLLVKYIFDYGKYDESDWELGYSYRFPSIGLGLWRPSIFEYEMINNPDFKEMTEENQLDELKYLYFEAICVYKKDYYDK
jgi:hypothetical protein